MLYKKDIPGRAIKPRLEIVNVVNIDNLLIIQIN